MARYEELKGKSVVVTGAGRGIGLAIARRFVQEGCRVMLTDLVEGNSAEVIAQAREAGTEAVFRRVDVCDRHQVESMVQEAVRLFGGLDVIVNNAGIIEIAPLVEVSEDSYDRQMSVNAKGVFLCATAAARQMLKQTGGRIINIASGTAKILPAKATPMVIYTMSKHAVVGLTKAMGVELAADNILVNCICPGIVDTSIWDQVDQEVAKREGIAPGTLKSRIVASIPIGRIEQPEDVANMAAWLASDDASYVTAQALNCCGGRLPY